MNQFHGRQYVLRLNRTQCDALESVRIGKFGEMLTVL